MFKNILQMSFVKIIIRLVYLKFLLFCFKTTRYMENTQNQGRIPNMMCFPDQSFYDAEQWFLVNTTTTKSYLTMIQISI